jgi:septum site-determining protein MinC
MTLIQNNPPSHAKQSTAVAFELKGRMMTLSVLRVLVPELSALREQLDAKIAAAPDLFHNFPVLLDFEDLPEEAQRGFDIARFNWLLRDNGFVPVGIRGAAEVLTGMAAGIGLGVVAAGASSEKERRGEPDLLPPRGAAANMLVQQPVRSGQQVYAEGGDLIVVAGVSRGAEILADGNIHLYGCLRGRALAGVRGNTAARIFCHSLDAELVSIAGRYRLSESIEESRRDGPVQIYLNGDSLVIETL